MIVSEQLFTLEARSVHDERRGDVDVDSDRVMRCERDEAESGGKESERVGATCFSEPVNADSLCTARRDMVRRRRETD